MLTLKSPIGTNYRVDPKDLVDAKRALNQLGYYDVPPHRGIDDWTDDATFSGIRKFQKDNGLKVDGFMRPGGPTEGAINQTLARASFGGGGHYNPGQPRDWHGRWTYAGGGGGKAFIKDKLSDTITRNAGANLRGNARRTCGKHSKPPGWIPVAIRCLPRTMGQPWRKMASRPWGRMAMCRKGMTSSLCNLFQALAAKMVTLPSSMESSGFPTLSNLGSGLGRDTEIQSLATPFIGAGISLLLTFLPSDSFASECRATEADASFHAASSQAERALDRLIRLENADGNMFLFEVKRPDRELKKDSHYRGLFTPSLERAWAEGEAELVRKDCGGKYQDGEICGMDFSPLTCAQDYSDKGYLYRTECMDETSAAITLRWPWIEAPVATYHVLKSGKRWVLDGVRCLPDGPDFNLPDSSDAARP